MMRELHRPTQNYLTRATEDERPLFSRHAASVCPSVCLSVSLFPKYGHSFQQIWTKFGTWHHNTPRIVKTGFFAEKARDVTNQDG